MDLKWDLSSVTTPTRFLEMAAINNAELKMAGTAMEVIRLTKIYATKFVVTVCDSPMRNVTMIMQFQATDALIPVR